MLFLAFVRRVHSDYRSGASSNPITTPGIRREEGTLAKNGEGSCQNRSAASADNSSNRSLKGPSGTDAERDIVLSRLANDMYRFQAEYGIDVSR
jgi:hypothetical protein